MEDGIALSIYDELKELNSHLKEKNEILREIKYVLENIYGGM